MSTVGVVQYAAGSEWNEIHSHDTVSHTTIYCALQ